MMGLYVVDIAIIFPNMVSAKLIHEAKITFK